LYTYIHNNGFITNVGELLSTQTSIFFQIDVNEFLLYKDENNLTNLENIISFNNDSKIDYKTKKLFIPLKNGVKLVIPEEKINKDLLPFYGGINLNYISDKQFRAKKIVDIENDKKYVKTYRQLSSNEQLGVLSDVHYSCTVLLWSKSFNQNEENRFLNISKFVENISANSGKNGGNFSLDLAAIKGSFIDGQWEIDNVFYNNSKDEYLSLFANTILVKEPLYGGMAKISDYSVKLESLFFHNTILQNDILFIRFEKLDLDEDLDEIFVKSSDLKGKNWDMIGLVDSNSLSAQEQMSVKIQGRDLSKLFIEDGSYFFPIEFAQGFSPINGKTTLRLPNNGEIFYLKYFQYKTIPEVLLFVLNNLTSANVCNKNLFDSFDYKETIKNTEQFKILNDINVKNISLKNDIIEKINFIRKMRNLVFYKEKQEKNTINEIFNKLINIFDFANNKGYIIDSNVNQLFYNGFTYQNYYIDSTKCQTLLLENIFEKTNEKYTIYEQLDLDLFNAVVQYVKNNEKIDKAKENNLFFKSEYIWRLIEIVIDDSIKNRILIDSSISTQSGSILNFLNKICQEPFVELLLDTYGDKYYLTVRTPPFSKKQVQSYIDLQKVDTEFGEILVDSLIQINPHEVESLNLQFNENNIFTWFQLIPKNLFFGNNFDFVTSYIPAKGFKEFIDIWGSKPMQITTNYIPNLQNQNAEKQTLIDLIYIIESNIYLPFTRSGTITLTGDRRIKKGSFIENKLTDEIFYVDSVTNSFNAQNNTRQTVVNVSRGMIKKYIKGVEVNGTLMSYFNIINVDEIKETVTKKVVRETVQKIENKKSEISVFIKPEFAKNISQFGLDYLKNKEKYSEKRYTLGEKIKTLDSIKKLYTIGYGHLIKQSEESKYNEAYIMVKSEAEALFLKDLKPIINTVNTVFSNLYQWEFDALVSFIFNTSNSSSGFIKIYKSFIILVRQYLLDRSELNGELLKNKWKYIAITAQGTGQVLQGLKKRREEEINMFLGNFKKTNYKLQQPDKSIISDNKQIIKEDFIDKVIEEKQINVKDVIENMSVNKEVFNYFLSKRNV
jgi:lysozyme